MKAYKIIRLSIISIVLAIITFFILYTNPINISKEFNGIRYRLGDSEYEEKIIVKVEGTFIKDFGKGGTYRGSMKIGDKELSDINIPFDRNGRGIIREYNGIYGYETYGDIYIEDIKDRFTICILEADKERAGRKNWSWSGSNGLMISVPADNRRDALEVSNQLMKDFLNGSILE